MRRIVVVLGVAVLMAATVVLTAGTALAQAETATFNEWIPISEELENNCTEEPFTLEGTFHMLLHGTTTENGNQYALYHHNVQAEGVSPSGAKYVATSVDQTLSTGDLTGNTHTVSARLKIHRQGEDGIEEDFIARSIFHVTQNVNGEWTAQVEYFEIECR